MMGGMLGWQNSLDIGKAVGNWLFAKRYLALSTRPVDNYVGELTPMGLGRSYPAGRMRPAKKWASDLSHNIQSLSKQVAVSSD
ncbi:MAG: hypothetical protein M0Z73_12945 [Betaproteobacteria bacterium]|nr:hypothetical protein [Betaproteobacteria bacterium]